jgi:hypothetical protein
MPATQRLIPVRCDGDPIPYLALIETAAQVWLPENWCSITCDDRSAPEFDDGATILSPVFPDTFDAHHGVHFVGHYGNFFLDMVVWKLLRKAVPIVAHWLDTSRIVVDDEFIP